MPHTDTPARQAQGGLDRPDKASEPAGTRPITEVEPIYFHDCPALGPHTRLIKAYLGSKDGKQIHGWQYKCPFCSQTEGEFHRVSDLVATDKDTSND